MNEIKKSEYNIKKKFDLINKVGFDENQVYLIDDYKTIYLWIGQKIPEKRKTS